jgi:hypothetical protein
VSTLLNDPVYVLLHNLLNVLVQIANKWDLKKNESVSYQALIVVKDQVTVTGI